MSEKFLRWLRSLQKPDISEKGFSGRKISYRLVELNLEQLNST